jgi:glutamate receptor ionotropic, NMDA 2B
MYFLQYPVIIFVLLHNTWFVVSLRGGGHAGIGSSKKAQLNIGLIAPHTNFGKREYLRAINSAVQGLQKNRSPKLTFFKEYDFSSSNM